MNNKIVKIQRGVLVILVQTVFILKKQYLNMIYQKKIKKVI